MRKSAVRIFAFSAGCLVTGNTARATPVADTSSPSVTICARVPTNTGTVYLTGNRPEIGNWNPAGLAMDGAGRERSATLHLPRGTQLEYKEELMPRVNQAFRTRTGPAHTSVMGSSMGGLISFWLCWKHPEVFSRAGCLSTAFPWNGHFPIQDSPESPLIQREIDAAAKVPRGIRLYFDYGTRTFDATIEPEQNKVNAWLVSQGLREGKDFTTRQFPGAEHNEAAWRARLDEPLIFLFANWSSDP